MSSVNNIMNNPVVQAAILIGVLGILAGITFFSAASAGLSLASTTIVSLLGVVVVMWVFGPNGPLKSR